MILLLVLFNFTNNDKCTILPSSFLFSAVIVSLDTFTNRLALVPSSVVHATIRPPLDTQALWFAVSPLTYIYLSIRETAFSREEL